MGNHDSNSCDNILLREIYKKLISIEEEVEKLKSKPEYHISIEKLDVQTLENLTFALDTLDIKDLSGTLNIGNNFDTKKPACKKAGKSSKKHKDKKACKEEVES